MFYMYSVCVIIYANKDYYYYYYNVSLLLLTLLHIIFVQLQVAFYSQKSPNSKLITLYGSILLLRIIIW